MTRTIATDLARADLPAGVVDAVAAADAAASSAGVFIRGLDRMAELDAVCDLFDRIWRFDGGHAPVSSELLRAMSRAGGYVAGAFEGDELVGACVGFFSPPAEFGLHSHIAGVSPKTRGRSVGFAMKVHQRAWAMAQGLTKISWTYDPLVGRNAYFNLVKLGARPAEYLANFYGPMNDALNAGDDTDRLMVTWQLEDPLVAAACAGAPSIADLVAERAAGAQAMLARSDSGDPVRHDVDARTVLIAVPPDIERLRGDDPMSAGRWRLAVRDCLGGLLDQGARVRGFARSDYYIVDRGDQS
ncbi:GNAT family N-acetyltransferase [Kribbella deserti]|uniref:GNAT family N-acetyltransferase n=1 Tax=Kribbella deserti TaxID=1926257 RepID=A0ABV6QMA5_9ACTN